jgi:hypothetical protein
MHNTGMRVGRVVVVVVVAVAVYAFALPSSHFDPALMANLSIRDPHVAALNAKPSTASTENAKKDNVKPVVTYATKDPTQTGVYETEWTGSKKSANDGGLLIQVVPDVSDAMATLTASVTAFKSPSDVGAVRHFSVPGVAATGSAYSIKASSSSAAGYAYTVIFRIGRVVVIELVELSQTAELPGPAKTIAQEEATLLESRAPSFSFEQTKKSALATWLVVIIGLVLAAAVFFGPEALVKRREAHEIHAQERARSQYRSRGRRAVTRHQAPAWRQQKRR